MSSAPVPSSDPGAPAIRALPSPDVAAGLPRPLTSFVGRDREIAALAALLARDDVRLVTLTGPGGVGKTRLALRVAERVGDAFDHTWYVGLAQIRRAGHVAPEISRAVGIREDVPRPLAEEIALLMRGGSALLVLDNLEQVLDAWPLVADLLDTCAALTVLVTSRSALRISGEHVFAVPPLALPADGEAVADLRQADAVALFVERAAAQAPGFALTEENAATVARICRELDGVPLAIELAAARVAAFSPATILDRLDARLAMLAEGPRDQPQRLRSMRDSIAWSHDLLNRAERALFRRLAVFAGPWTLGAAGAVAGDAELPVLDGVAALVSASLVRHVGELGGESRYAMLETIREFAVERLAESGEEATLRSRHAAWCLAFARETAWGWFRPLDEGTAMLRSLEAAHADARAALGWLARSGDDAMLLDLAGMLVGLWCVCGHPEEGRGWLERALATDVAVDAETRGLALGALSFVLVQRGASGAALEVAMDGIALLRAEGASLAKVLCLAEAGMAARHLGDFEAAVTWLHEAIATLGRIGGDVLPAAVRDNWRISLEAGLGHTAVMQGDIDRAADHYGRARDLQVAGGHAPGASHIFGSHVVAGLGDVARAMGRPAEALGHYRTSLAQAWRAREVRAVGHALGGMAASLAMLRRHDEAATLFGATEAFLETHGYRFDMETLDRQRALGLPEPWARAGEPCGVWEALREAVAARRPAPMPPVPDAALARWAAGRRLSPEAAVAMALAVEPGAGAGPAAEDLAGLSPREVEVLRLLATGQTDLEIAEALYISRRTAATHVRHIYDKLGVSTRAAAAAWAVRQGLA